MSELSCDTPFIGQIETHDLVRNQDFSKTCLVEIKLVVVRHVIRVRSRIIAARLVAAIGDSAATAAIATAQPSLEL